LQKKYEILSRDRSWRDCYLENYFPTKLLFANCRSVGLNIFYFKFENTKMKKDWAEQDCYLSPLATFTQESHQMHTETKSPGLQNTL